MSVIENYTTSTFGLNAAIPILRNRHSHREWLDTSLLRRSSNALSSIFIRQISAAAFKMLNIIAIATAPKTSGNTAISAQTTK